VLQPAYKTKMTSRVVETPPEANVNFDSTQPDIFFNDVSPHSTLLSGLGPDSFHFLFNANGFFSILVCILVCFLLVKLTRKGAAKQKKRGSRVNGYESDGSSSDGEEESSDSDESSSDDQRYRRESPRDSRTRRRKN
jgi:hypothetical protein